jgi:hypothetical protein
MQTLLEAILAKASNPSIVADIQRAAAKAGVDRKLREDVEGFAAMSHLGMVTVQKGEMAATVVKTGRVIRIRRA